jgi:hypothetical protein
MFSNISSPTAYLLSTSALIVTDANTYAIPIIVISITSYHGFYFKLVAIAKLFEYIIIATTKLIISLRFCDALIGLQVH